MPAALRILLVDADVDVRQSLRALLEAHRLEVVDATVADASSPAGAACDCWILDLDTPGHRGLELLKRRRQEPPGPPVIAIAGWGGNRVRMAALAEGAVAFLEKPFPESQLLRAIRCATARGIPERGLTEW